MNSKSFIKTKIELKLTFFFCLNSTKAEIQTTFKTEFSLYYYDKTYNHSSNNTIHHTLN